MLFVLYTTPIAAKALKKLPKDIKQHLLKELQVLRTQPHTGEQLKGKLRVLRSLHTRYKNTEYRVAYQVQVPEHAITILYVASGENFYRQLEKLPFRSVA